MFGKSGSLALDDFLDVGGKEQVDATCVIGILGTVGKYQCCGMESAACAVEEVSSEEWVTCY